MLSELLRKFVLMLVNRQSHFFDIYEELSRLQWLPTNELVARQHKKAREIIDFAYHNVPLYRRRMRAAGIVPGDFCTLNDLSLLPVVSKDEIRHGFPGDVVANGRSYHSGIASFTSGSTQTPFYMYLDRSVRGIALASRLLFDSWVGITPVERHVDIRVFPKLIDRIFLNELQISAFDVSSMTADMIFDRIKAFHPKALNGHPSALVLIASYVLENNLDGVIRPKAVFPWGETLIPQHRAILERAFQCPVLARYGAAELGGPLAQECPDGCAGYHVNTELGVLEVVDDTGFPVSPGEKGKVVVTNLWNRLMPLIRYDLGDVAVQGDTPKCGRGFPIVRSIEGRAVDLVETRTGSMRPLPDFHIPPRFWRYVWRYQFVQDRRGHLKVLIVPTKEYDAGKGDDILTSLQASVGDIEFEISAVSEIAPDKSGKRPLLRRRLD